MARLCETCRFWWRTAPDNGFCHRSEPMAEMAAEGKVRSWWPPTAPGGGCGEQRYGGWRRLLDRVLP
jgi:hypothetical protein